MDARTQLTRLTIHHLKLFLNTDSKSCCHSAAPFGICQTYFSHCKCLLLASQSHHTTQPLQHNILTIVTNVGFLTVWPQPDFIHSASIYFLPLNACGY